MIDDSCKVPREDLDDGFNPCRKQVVENGELCQYAHMYDVMNERYDREEDTSYLNSVKRDRISQSTPSQSTGGGKIYSQDTNGVEGFISTSGTLEPSTNAEIPSSKAVADYVAANIPDVSSLEAEIDKKQDKLTLPLSIEQGGTGGNTPYMTDDLDNSAIFVMHDAPNDRYGAAPMSALRNYLTTQFMSFDNESIPKGADLNTYKEPGNYSVRLTMTVPTVVNKPNDVSMAFNLYVVPILSTSNYSAQYLVEYGGGRTYYRHYSAQGWSSWNLLYPTSSTVPNLISVDQGGTGAQTRSLKSVDGLTLLPVIDSIGASGALNGYTSVTNIATFITTNKIRPEITAAFENHTADAVANNDLLPTNALMMGYVDGNLINYNGITVSGGGTSNIIYNRVRLKNNCIYGDCDFTVNSEGDDGGVKVNIIIDGTDINIPPVFTKFILSNKPLLVHKSSNTIIEGKNIYNVSNGNVIIQFNIGDFNTGEFIFIVDSVFTGYNQAM